MSVVTSAPATVATPTVRGVATGQHARRARWARRPLRHGLARLHPVAALACILGVLAAGFVVTNPLALAMLLALIVVSLFLARRARAALPYLRVSLLIAAFVIVINPLFSRGGLDVLWRLDLPLFDLMITVQGLLFGVGSALRLCVVVWAFALYNVVLNSDDQLALMSSFSFRSGLVVSLATRLFPVLSRDTARVSDAQRARGVELDGGRRRDRLAARLPLLGALLARSLDRSVDLAESMEARGYGRLGRRRWRAGRRWRTADRFVVVAAAVSVVALAAGVPLGAYRYRFFPLLDDPWAGLGEPAWLAAFGALCLGCVVAPLLLEAPWRR